MLGFVAVAAGRPVGCAGSDLASWRVYIRPKIAPFENLLVPLDRAKQQRTNKAGCTRGSLNEAMRSRTRSIAVRLTGLPATQSSPAMHTDVAYGMLLNNTISVGLINCALGNLFINDIHTASCKYAVSCV